MEYIVSKLFGKVALPTAFSEIIELSSIHANERRNVYMWRGQADINWALHSSAYRRLSKNGVAQVSERNMRDYEKRIISEATHQGYDYDNGRKLTDLEILAKLQHHGAATRLVDFSRNMLVALWFACKSEEDKTGLLFGIHTEHLGGFEGRPENRSYNETLGNDSLKIHNHPQTWQPPVVTKRIAAQSAQFLYSSVSDHPAGSLSFVKDNKAMLPIAITSKLKPVLLELLEGTFDIRLFTLFPDLDGFCLANSEHFEVYSNHRW